MPHMRNITVQFAVPVDDPNYRLTDLRDEIQEALELGARQAASSKITLVL